MMKVVVYKTQLLLVKNYLTNEYLWTCRRRNYRKLDCYGQYVGPDAARPPRCAMASDVPMTPHFFNYDVDI